MSKMPFQIARQRAAQAGRCIASGLSLFRNGPKQWGKGEELP